MKHLHSCNLPQRNSKSRIEKGNLFLCCIIRPAGGAFVYLVLSSTLLQLLSVMKSNAEDMQLLLTTDEVLLNLHPMMFLLRTDAVAMTTVTIGVERKKRISPGQLSVC